MRLSMTNIVAFLRHYGQANAEEEFGGVTYWSDDQLEEIADSWSAMKVVQLETVQFESPTIYRLKIPKFDLMENSFTIYDSGQDVVATVATYNQNRQELTFVSGLNVDEDYFVMASFTKGYDALADLWSQKASQRYDYIDFKAGNNKMNMKEEYDNCVARAAYYRAKTIRRWPRQKGKWAV
jgi:hypothetical protein